MKRKTTRIALLTGFLYCLMLFLLITAEKNAPGASITGIGQAVWYSLTTLTTVGYGDMYPVTVPGRLIGAVFQVLSIGVLVALITVAFSLLRGRLLPLAWLRFKRNSHWYIFSRIDPRHILIAQAIAREDHHAVILFCDDGTDHDLLPVGIVVALSPEKLVEYQKAKGGATVFAMRDDQSANDRLAESLRTAACRVCVMSDYEPDRLSDKLILFDPYHTCARLYWFRYPVTSPDETIVLIGEGKYAEALLEQALLFNVTAPDQMLSYHVIGDFGNFRRNHPFLDQAFASCDRLFFHADPWNEDLDLLKHADRIIFCHDDPERSLDEVTQLKRYCPVKGTLYVRGAVPLNGYTSFGMQETICQPGYILRSELYQTAVRLHRLYQDSVPDAPDWNALTGFLRRSNLASADHLLMKVRILLDSNGETLPGDSAQPSSGVLARAAQIYRSLDEQALDRCRRIEHERWMRFHLMNNWQYAPVRDNEQRLHPLLRPYDELNLEDRMKDSQAWELIEKLSGGKSE